MEKSWDDANADCASHGGYLAEMDSEAEWTHVHAEKIRLERSGYHWLGAKGHGKYGGWKWVKSQRYIQPFPTGVGNWYSSSPNEEVESCLISTPKERNNNWEDRPCHGGYRFICEFS